VKIPCEVKIFKILNGYYLMGIKIKRAKYCNIFAKAKKFIGFPDNIDTLPIDTAPIPKI